MSSVIAICGTMGSGKTTLMKSLHASLPNSVVVTEDDFNPAFTRSIDDVREWRDRGADVDEFDLSAVGSAIVAAETASVVLLETHFGRLHSTLRPLIDLQLWIDVPLDIAFARKVAQLTQMLPTQLDDVAAALNWLAEFCDSYLQTTRPMFEQQRQQVGGQSDERIDGTLRADLVADAALRLLRSQF